MYAMNFLDSLEGSTGIRRYIKEYLELGRHRI